MKSNFFLSILVFGIFQFKICAQTKIVLDTNWKFTQAEYIHWLPCQIPGNCYSALFENHKIPHPYHSNNEDKLQWIDYRNWLFKTHFEIDSQFLVNEFIQLEFPGLDTYCKIYLNGHYVGNSYNAFRHWTYNVKKLVQPGTNELLLEFQSTLQIADSLYNGLKYKLPGDGSRVMVRKPQYQFGWDFAPKFVSAGITDSVFLMGWNGIQFHDASVHTLFINDSTAELKLNTKLFINDTTSRYVLKLDLDTLSYEFPIQAGVGTNTISRYFHIQNPRLWWPNGAGDPYLYDTRLQLYKNNELYFEKSWKTGIRTIRLHAQADSIGRSFSVVVNGKPIFCKGANYVPTDILQFSHTDYSTLLQTAVDCHFNMLRVWGGGHYETDAFYKACDEKGIMIWQDFMYACAMYPGDDNFLINATIEAEQQVERLSKYACIALWCGNNEISEGWHRWGWQDELTAEGVQTIWNDYQSLFDNILPIVVDKYSNVTDYWQSSPMFGRGDPGFNKQGDAHDWGLWHDELPFETIKKRVPRFMSEFGIQSLPEMETFEKVIPEDELHIDSSLLQSRQKHIRGNSIIKKYIEDECPYPSDLNALIFLSQYIQAEGMGNLITSHRMAKPYCMGSLYWQFNDCWPAISWSGMDYYGNWKAFQYKVKQVFQDVLLSASVEDERIVVKAVSDLFYHDTVICELFFQDFSGNPIFYDQWKNIIPPNTATTLYSEEIPFKDLQFSDSYYILLKWRRDNKEYAEVQLLDKLKNLKLPDPELSISSLEKMENGYRFHISAKHLAKSVELKSNFPIHFMPNYFDLNPGETIEVRCKTDIEEFDASQINIRSLFNFIK